MHHVIEQAISTHLAWMEAFETDLAEGRLSNHVIKAAHDDQCEFGIWLYSVESHIKHLPQFKKVKNLHFDFHSVAGQIVELMKSRQFEEAKQLIENDYKLITTDLQRALREWQDQIRG